MFWVGNNWAMTVTSKPWAFTAEVLDRLKRLTGNRLFIHSSHRAWEKAIGI